MRIRLPLVLIASMAVGFCGCSKRSEEAPPAGQTAQTTTDNSKSNDAATAPGTTTNFESQPAPAAPAPKQ